MNSGTERRPIDRLSSQSHKFTPAFDPFFLFQWQGQFSCCSHSETFTPSVSALRSSLRSFPSSSSSSLQVHRPSLKPSWLTMLQLSASTPCLAPRPWSDWRSRLLKLCCKVVIQQAESALFTFWITAKFNVNQDVQHCAAALLQSELHCTFRQGEEGPGQSGPALAGLRSAGWWFGPFLCLSTKVVKA